MLDSRISGSSAVDKEEVRARTNRIFPAYERQFTCYPE
jgi:hypothetical protein